MSNKIEVMKKIGYNMDCYIKFIISDSKYLENNEQYPDKEDWMYGKDFLIQVSAGGGDHTTTINLELIGNIETVTELIDALTELKVKMSVQKELENSQNVQKVSTSG